MIKFITIFIFVLFLAGIVKGQKNVDSTNNNFSFILVNTYDTIKRVTLNPKEYCSLHYLDLSYDGYERNIILWGSFLDVTSNQILFSFYSEEDDFIQPNGESVFTNINYYHKQHNDFNFRQEQRLIDRNKLVSVSYTKPGKRKIKGIAIIAMSLSVATALIIAPTISINFRNETFNKQRYYTTLICGGVGIVVSLPLLFSGKSKSYKITEPNNKISKSYWYIEKRKK